MKSEILFKDNDMVVEVRQVSNEVTGAFLNAATVACTLKDAAGANVSGQSWPLTMAYVTSSDGVYRGTLDAALGITANGRYTLTVTIDGGTGLQGQWEMPCLAKVRG